jgi:protein gp37
LKEASKREWLHTRVDAATSQRFTALGSPWQKSTTGPADGWGRNPMAETKIEWCDYTFNPWWGCTKVSPACDHCYAEALAKRYGEKNLWGVKAARRFFGLKHWAEPLKWDMKARKEGKRFRVFCASMADVFDNHPDVGQAREMLWELIKKTPRLDWLVLTKRIGNTVHMLPEDWGQGYPNVWLGISVVNQEEADRDIPKLIHTPAEVRFLSCEPLLGPIDFSFHPHNIDWCIVGGESGSDARPMYAAWALDIHDFCALNQIAFFMKQGSQANWPTFKKFETFPPELQRREWPR